MAKGGTSGPGSPAFPLIPLLFPPTLYPGSVLRRYQWVPEGHSLTQELPLERTQAATGHAQHDSTGPHAVLHVLPTFPSFLSSGTRALFSGKWCGPMALPRLQDPLKGHFKRYKNISLE